MTEKVESKGFAEKFEKQLKQMSNVTVIHGTFDVNNVIIINEEDFKKLIAQMTGKICVFVYSPNWEITYFGLVFHGNMVVVSFKQETPSTEVTDFSGYR